MDKRAQEQNAHEWNRLFKQNSVRQRRKEGERINHFENFDQRMRVNQQYYQ